MAREFQRSLEQAANEAGVSEMSKSLRSIDQSLNSATDSARKFARQPMRAVMDEAVMKPAAEAPPASPAPPAAPAPETDAAPVAGPAEGEERAAAR
jgi:sec-independent protein translocase protein TatB